MRWVRLINISQKMCFQVMSENAKTQSWVTKTVGQQVHIKKLFDWLIEFRDDNLTSNV